MAEVDKKLREVFQKEVEGIESKQREIGKCVEIREKLESQLNENTIVKEELDILELGANVFKQVGPVLVKQDLEEAKVAVANRISFISTELSRQEKNIVSLQKDQEGHKEQLKILQSKLTPPKST